MAPHGHYQFMNTLLYSGPEIIPWKQVSTIFLENEISAYTGRQGYLIVMFIVFNWIPDHKGYIVSASSFHSTRLCYLFKLMLRAP